MGKGKLLARVETKDYRIHNFLVATLLVSGLLLMFGILPIAVCSLLFASHTAYENLWIALAIFVTILGSTALLLDVLVLKFRRKSFELYENGFLPIQRRLMDGLRRKDDFVPYSSVVRVEKEKKDTMTIDPWTGQKRKGKSYGIALYTREGECTVIWDSSVGSVMIRRLLELLREDSERERREIEWADGIVPFMSRQRRCREIEKMYMG